MATYTVETPARGVLKIDVQKKIFDDPLTGDEFVYYRAKCNDIAYTCGGVTEAAAYEKMAAMLLTQLSSTQ